MKQSSFNSKTNHFISYKSSAIFTSNRCKRSQRSMVHGWTTLCLFCLIYRSSSNVSISVLQADYARTALITMKRRTHSCRPLWSHYLIVSPEECKVCKWRFTKLFRTHTHRESYTRNLNVSWFNTIPSSTLCVRSLHVQRLRVFTYTVGVCLNSTQLLITSFLVTTSRQQKFRTSVVCFHEFSPCSCE